MNNGSAYAFSRDINVNWKHGIPQIQQASGELACMTPVINQKNEGFQPDNYCGEGRISIIAWGMVELD